MHITGEMKMVDVVHEDIQLLAVIQRLNIRLGFREKTVREVCDDHDVDLSFFLQLCNSYHDKEYLPAEQFQQFPVEWIIKYLRNAHRCYIDHRIPRIEQQIVTLEKENTGNVQNMELLLNFFREYIREFSGHIDREETDVFPYILSLDKSLQQQDVSQEFVDHFDDYSIDKYLEDHNLIEEKLFDLKNILLKYLPPPVDDCKYNNLLFDLFRLESDLMDHADLEEKVLFPRVRNMEIDMKQLQNRN